MNKQLAIVIPFLNETSEDIIGTLKSIYDNFDSDFIEIVAIDDCSQNETDLSQFKEVSLIRNQKRMGVDWCRDMGVKVTTAPYLFILDSHMKFANGDWGNIIADCLKREPETVFCTTCLGLGYGTMDLTRHKGKYYAADILLTDPLAPPDRQSRECLEPKWRNKEEGIEYDVPAVLGANYFMTRKWFNYIHGFKGLQMWGSSEVFLSLKSWMCGGKCKIRTDLEIGHKFRSDSPFSTGIFHLYFNKIYICEVLSFPKDLREKILGCLPKNANYDKATKAIEEIRPEIEVDKEYYKSITKYDIYDYCNRFNINLP